MTYYDESEELTLIESSSSKGSENKKREKNYESKKNQASTALKQYQDEITATNILYTECESEYNQLIYKNKEIKESNLHFLKDVFMKYNDHYSKLGLIFNIPNIFEEYTETIDMGLYTEDFNFCSNDSRLEKEVFSSYDAYKTQNQNETKNSSSSSLSSLSSFDNYKNIISSFAFSTGEEFFSSFERSAFNFYTKPLLNFKGETNLDEDDQSISAFLKLLFTSAKMPNEAIQLFKDNHTDLDFCTFLLDEYLKTYPQTSFCFLNNENLTTFAGLLIQLINSLNLTEIKSFDLLTSILFISEWSYSGDIYLCYLLGKFNFFKTKLSWVRMIEYRLLLKLQQRVNEFRAQNKQQGGSSITKGLFNTFSNIFNKAMESDIEEIEEEPSIITDFGFNTRLENYPKLTKAQKDILNNEFVSFVHITLKEYITNLCNFNYDLSEGIELIVEIAMKYSLDSYKVNLYLTLFNIAGKTIRRGSNTDRNPSEIDQKIKNIKNKNNTFILLKYPSSPSTDEEKQIMLQKIMPFIETKAKITLFVLNKTISPKLMINFYNNFLLNNTLKEITITDRLNIWKAVLHTEAVSSTIDYAKSIEFTNMNDSKETNIIELDVARTAFPSNVEENRLITIRILKCLLYLKPEIKYYQGMNYIAAFMLRLTGNEKESFILLYGLFSSTDLGILFSQNLNKLKAFLLIVDRLLLINLPTLYYYFKEHSVNTNYYVTPWLVTLFTNILQFMKEKKEISIIVLKIWDEFILKGWKALMEAILALIYFHKDEIIEKKDDSLFKFLINDLVKSPCFLDENYSKWIEIKKKIHVSSKIIKYIEEEIEIEHLLD